MAAAAQRKGMPRVIRYNDTRVTTAIHTRYFAHHVYVDPYVMIEDVMQPGFFDEGNKARSKDPCYRVMHRIECECADGWVLLRVMSMDAHNLNIVTRPLQEPVYWAEEALDENEDAVTDNAPKRRGRPPKVDAA